MNKPPASNNRKKLVNNLTVADAKHLLQNEGGPLDLPTVIFQLISSFVVAGFTARAIWKGNATVWHLALPSVAEYLGVLVALPLIYPFARLDAIWVEVRKSLLWLGAMAVLIAAGTYLQSLKLGASWQAQFTSNAQIVWHWIYDANMHWPMALAAVSMLASLPQRVANLKQFGPPFVAVGLGCAMRLILLIFGLFLLPMVLSGDITRAAWILWALLLLSEVLALWMHWDVQTRLKKEGALDDERVVG